MGEAHKAVPCDRKQCRGDMHVQAWSQEAGGVRRWLVCDVDARHTVDRYQPGHDDRQDTLPGLDLTDG